MRFNRLFALAMVVGAISLAAPNTHAALVSFNFADPGADVPNGGYSSCDASLQDRCAPSLDFTNDGLTVTASVLAGASSAAIIQDLDPDRGGLGIVDSFTDDPPRHTGNDNVSDDETILLTFDVPVYLYSVGFFDDHESLPHSFPSDANFLFSVDGSAYVSYALTGALGPSGRVIGFGGLFGREFAFKHAGQDKDDFYIGTLTADPDPIPEPGTLLLLGSGVVGLFGRARRRARG